MIKYLRIVVCVFSNFVYLLHLMQRRFSIKLMYLNVIEENKMFAIHQHYHLVRMDSVSMKGAFVHLGTWKGQELSVVVGFE